MKEEIKNFEDKRFCYNCYDNIERWIKIMALFDPFLIESIVVDLDTSKDIMSCSTCGVKTKRGLFKITKI